MGKNKNITFNYRADPQGNLFPIVPISLEFGGQKKEVFALIDSGATISIFLAEIAESLGLKIENGKETYLHGVGGRIKGYRHEIKVEIGGQSFVCPIIFSREYLVSFNLLGRQEFFPRFRIIFEEKKKRLSLG